MISVILWLVIQGHFTPIKTALSIIVYCVVLFQSSKVSGTKPCFFFYLLRTISLIIEIIDTFDFFQGSKVNIPYIVLINIVFNEIDD